MSAPVDLSQAFPLPALQLASSQAVLAKVFSGDSLRSMLSLHYPFALALISLQSFDRDNTGKINMYFVTSGLFQITCIPSNTDKPLRESNLGCFVLI